MNRWPGESGFIPFIHLISKSFYILLQIGLKREDVEKFLFLLKNTYIIDLVQPFYKNKVNELKKMPKLFFLDNGIRNHLILNYQELENRADKGALIENCVWAELIKNKSILHEVKFWRTTAKTEIDFILSYQGAVYPIEVKYKNNITSIPRAIKTFVDTYNSPKAWVITKNQSFQAKYDACDVTFLPAFFSAKILQQVS